jgi:predicted house-cleaning NTP pyrophosphatase (Maf/HAM1 superfamily)
MPLPIILASSSPYRRKLLDRLGLNYSTVSPNIDECPKVGEHAAALAQRLSIAKSQAIAADYPSHLIIGSDQVASLGTEIIGKPGNHCAALAQLERCSGQSVLF